MRLSVLFWLALLTYAIGMVTNERFLVRVISISLESRQILLIVSTDMTMFSKVTFPCSDERRRQ